MKSIQVFAPASVSNIGCGFDILGFPINNVGDILTLSLIDAEKSQIINSGESKIPLDYDKNVVGFAINALLIDTGLKQSFSIEIKKGVKPGSGIGSSASSSVAAVYAVNELLNLGLSKMELVKYAMEGERIASGDAHADNVAPAMLGGITLIRSYTPLDIIQITPPRNLYTVVLHPQIEVKTSVAREILRPDVPLKTAVKQWGNVAGLIAGFYTSDFQLIKRSIEDYIVEPQRARLINGYYTLKEAALQAGAIGCNISGSGPSVFALAEGNDMALKIKQAMENAYATTGIEYNSYISEISNQGARVV